MRPTVNRDNVLTISVNFYRFKAIFQANQGGSIRFLPLVQMMLFKLSGFSISQTQLFMLFLTLLSIKNGQITSHGQKHSSSSIYLEARISFFYSLVLLRTNIRFKCSSCIKKKNLNHDPTSPVCSYVSCIYSFHKIFFLGLHFFLKLEIVQF